MQVTLLRFAVIAVAIACFYFGWRYIRVTFRVNRDNAIYRAFVLGMTVWLFFNGGVLLYCLTVF
jgi:hypothetical protein